MAKRGGLDSLHSGVILACGLFSRMVIEQWVVSDLRSTGGRGPSFQQGHMLQYQVSKPINNLNIIIY